MTTTTICQDLDAAVVQGLRLLHSTDPDSEDQLYQLWKQCVYEKYGLERTPTSVLHKVNIPSGLKREGAVEPSDDLAIVPKKSKLDSSAPLFQKSAPSSPSSNTVSSYIPDDLEDNNSTSENDSDSDTPLEILSGEGTCMKCKKSSFSSDNKLVECVDCHKYYHQECHFPPITDMDLSDPRFVWYCAACEENISTTTSNERNRNSGNSSKTATSSSSTKSSSSSSKSSRSYGSSVSSHRSSSNSGSTSQSSSSSNNKTSSNSSPKTSSSSSSSHDKKNSSSKSSHLMKKRSLKKPDKKKSSK